MQSQITLTDLSNQVDDRAEATGCFNERVLQIGFIGLFVAREFLRVIR